jgi:16S rRNA (uracil1498-N3)-methyltransferase
MPKLPRFFISPEQVSGTFITITDEDIRHIATVLRMDIGDHLLLCDGKGTEYIVKIDQVLRSGIKTKILERIKTAIRFPRVTLGQGLPKSDKMEWIIQKATELGVAAIVPLVTERTIIKVRAEEKRLVRWRKICREAAMQSNRTDIPNIASIQRYPVFLANMSNLLEYPFAKRVNKAHPIANEGGREKFSSNEILRILPWEEAITPIKNVLRANTDVRNIVVLIGPEGGFSAAEAEIAQENGFCAVSLGSNILRTETAAVAVLSMILYEMSAND